MCDPTGEGRQSDRVTEDIDKLVVDSDQRFKVPCIVDHQRQLKRPDIQQPWVRQLLGLLALGRLDFGL